MARAATAVQCKDMFGDKLYQSRARAALPVLVQYAKAERILPYSDLAKILDIPNPRNLNYVLGSIGVTLDNLDRDRKYGIPRIQTLVVSKTTGQPGKGIDGFFPEMDRSSRKEAMDEEQEAVFLFDDWDRILEDLDLEPASNRFGDAIKLAREFRGGGEGKDHRKLKEWVCANPQLVGLKWVILSVMERRLASGDCLDVSFQNADQCMAVEVKASTSSEADIARGIFQIVKYKAVMKAELKVGNAQIEYDALLIVENKLSSELCKLARKLSVEVIQVAKHKNGYARV